ncbi:hypothetical protein CcCBS67573_g09733 [Chytriomyces confervae]|uniref:F-box protein Hrt3/FBXO9 C-terminal domain-containing protein n=1 Tax=Chytriomyces confervae TaxID=246404 RepID=A0A507DNS3_9FUNG|nr:hypothetical protein CcCBS67573_g09733 [Chytriomyces confervae]
MTTHEWIAWRWQSVEVSVETGDQHLDIAVKGEVELPSSVGNAREEKDKQQQQQQQDAVRLSKALLLYNEASICEREGRLGDALTKYRQATRLEPNIDRMHHVKQSVAVAAAAAQQPSVNQRSQTHSVDEFDENSLQTYYSFGGGAVQPLPVVHDSTHTNVRFTPKHAEKPIPIAVLPSEIVTHVVKWTLALDFAMLPEIASTCKFLQRTTLAASQWRFLCEKHHGRSRGYSTHSLKLSEQLAKSYRNCWRAMYCEKPRLSFDGVYISRINYIRQGYAESFTNPYLIVTYFRYLRLFQDGSMCIWTTSTEPTQALKELSNVMDSPTNTRSLQQALGNPGGSHASVRYRREKSSAIAALKGLLFGTWKLHDDLLVMETAENVNGFYYKLSVSSTRRASHNKLSWMEFYHYKKSGDAEKEEASRNEIKSQRKAFVFSKVRSWKRASF